MQGRRVICLSVGLVCGVCLIASWICTFGVVWRSACAAVAAVAAGLVAVVLLL